MKNLNVILSILILIGVIIIYKKLENNESIEKENLDYDLVRQYLLNEDDLGKNKKPIIWIPVILEKNSRKWLSFNSRNSYNLNQDYLYLTIKSIINKCGNDFHICLIDDNAIHKLLPEFNVDLQIIGNPVKSHIYNLCLSKILYNYGGLILPPSFICLNSFIYYYNNMSDNGILVSELNNTAVGNSIYSPNNLIMGCKQNSTLMHEYCQYLEYLNSTNYTSSVEFENLENKWFINKKNIYKIPANELGIIDKNKKLISIDDLLSDSYIPFDLNILGIYLPQEQLLNRNKYNWFVYLNNNDVLNSDTQIGKYLLYACN